MVALAAMPSYLYPINDYPADPKRGVVGNLVDSSQMMALLLAACPSFESGWRGFLAEWADEPDLPYYVALGEFARHLSLVLVNGDKEVLRKVFDVLEQLILEGDSYVKNAAIAGLIEDLQNLNLHAGSTPERYLPFLLPESRRWWVEVETQWNGGTRTLDSK
jgi:hypothetical protein